MAKKNNVALMTLFPALLTLGKLVQNKGPERFLKALDSKENRSPKGKQGMFNGHELLDEVYPMDNMTEKDSNNRIKRLNKNIDKLVHQGLIEQHPDNSFLVRSKRTYRLTTTARTAVKYL